MAHDILRALIRRGAYREAAAFAENLSAETRSDPLIALERARGFLKQGHPINAERALALADLSRATPGQRLVIALETAALQIYRRVAIREAVRDAKAAFANADATAISRGDWAEAERVNTRILLSAVTYHEISAEAGQQARDRLLEIAEILTADERIDEALAARLTYAEKLDQPSARIDALLKLSQVAIEADRPNLAAESLLIAADQMIIAGEARERITETLDKAATLYRQGNHAHGQIDVALTRAKLEIEREFAGPDGLQKCVEAYAEIDFPRGEFNVLMELSQLVHQRGDTSSAAKYRQRTLALSETVGMGLARDSFQTAQIDLLMRNGDYGGAIELCEAAIASEPPAMLKAGYEQLMGAAYSFINDTQACIAHTRAAIRMFEEVQAIDSASDAIVKLSSDLSSLRQEEAWHEAENLLLEWADKDEARLDFAAAASKHEMIAQVKIARFLYSRVTRGDGSLLEAGEQAITKGESLAQLITGHEAALRLGSFQQLRGQIYGARGDEESVIQAWRNALALFARADLGMYAANCYYMLGVIFLNRANHDLLANFGEAEKNLRTALEYYESAGMRGQAADARFMFACLYVNAALRVNNDLRVQMLDAALGHLSNGEADYDAMRQEFNAGKSSLEVQQGKRALIEKSQRIYQLALEVVCRFQPNAGEAWNWVQRSKARALSDILGTGSAPPSRVMTDIQKHPDSFQLLTQERELAVRIDKTNPIERVELRKQLDGLRQRMREDPSLSEYMELRVGTALDATDLNSMFSETVLGGRACVCVDWFAIEDQIFLIAVRPGSPAEIVEVPVSLDRIRSFVRNDLAPDSFRVTLRDVPEVLREFDPLIAPLATLSNEEDLLICSPTGPLHVVPLHALEIDSQPLLARNPVVFCPSLSVLRLCLARQRESTINPASALFGDPNGDLPDAAALMSHLEELLSTKALIGKDVTRASFVEAVSSCDLIHFQGHAVHKPSEPLDSFLSLADGPFTARDIFDLPKLKAEFVTLAACESATSEIAPGDEPLGLIPAFLYAGGNSVLATLWKVQETSAALTMRLFYDMLADRNAPADKVSALRRAMLAVRATRGFESPYFWAPFVLQGNWR